MQGRDSEDVWSRFVFELVIWPKEVTLVSRTQLSGPLCLWQCFRFRLWLDFKQHSMAVTKTTCIWEFWPEPRNRSPRSWLESRYTSGRRIKIRLIAEDKTIVRLEGFIVHAGGRCCWYLRNSVRPNYKVLLIVTHSTGALEIYETLWDQTIKCYSLRNVASLSFRCLTSALLMLSF